MVYTISARYVQPRKTETKERTIYENFKIASLENFLGTNVILCVSLKEKKDKLFINKEQGQIVHLLFGIYIPLARLYIYFVFMNIK